jgi:RNA polymerase sigma factor for flagellar operon FliA
MCSQPQTVKIEAAVAKLEQKFGRQPSEAELADEMEMPLSVYQHILSDARGSQLLHYEDFQESDDNDFFDFFLADNQSNPLAIIEDKGFRQMLVTSISNLPEREKLVMGLYYEKELNLKEIGQVMGVSESRICQLHSQAVARLRARMKEWTQNP